MIPLLTLTTTISRRVHLLYLHTYPCHRKPHILLRTEVGSRRQGTIGVVHSSTQLCMAIGNVVHSASQPSNSSTRSTTATALIYSSMRKLIPKNAVMESHAMAIARCKMLNAHQARRSASLLLLRYLSCSRRSNRSQHSGDDLKSKAIFLLFADYVCTRCDILYYAERK